MITTQTKEKKDYYKEFGPTILKEELEQEKKEKNYYEQFGPSLAAPTKVTTITPVSEPSIGQQILAGVKRTAEVPLGLLEAGAQLGTGMGLGFPAAIARSVIAPILNEDYEKAEKEAGKLAYKLTYEPQTEAGRVYGELLHKPLQFAGKLLQKASEKVAPDSPEAQSVFRTLTMLQIIGALPTISKPVKSFVRKKILKKEPILLSDIKPTAPIEPAATPVQKVINALKEARPLRKEQEILYTLERGKRFTKAEKIGKKVRGEKGFYAEKARLAGELPKVQFETIKEKLTQTDIESMFDQVKDSPRLTYLETFPAREGLAKLLGEYGSKLPTEGELVLLNRVFPREFTQVIMSKRPTWQKIKAGMLEGANVPRALMASYDLSFGLRQGIFLAARYPKQFASAFAKQFRLFGSEKAFRLLTEEIASRPTHELMQRSRLALTEMDSVLRLREEAFMGALWAEKIPIIGLGVRASARAYTGMANKLRADVFDYLVKTAEKTGRDPWKDTRLTNNIADFVNTGSGRGSLAAAERAAVILNTTLFSPRLVMSRLKLLNPVYYMKLDPFVRKQALQSLFAFTGAGATVLGLAKAGGLEVGVNPFSADFGKIKIGNTRIDIWGGFQPYIRTAAQLIAGKTVSTTTGKVTKLGEGYKPSTRLGVLSRWVEYKQAPIVSFATDLLRGRTVLGEELNLETTIGQRFIPMVIQDMIDLAKDDPELFPISALGIFGVGLQTYKPKKKEGVIY